MPLDPPRFAVNLTSVNIFGKAPKSLSPGMPYYGEPLYCHATYDGTRLNVVIDELRGDHLNPAQPPDPVDVVVTLNYKGPNDTASTVTWDAVSASVTVPLAWSIRISEDGDMGIIYIYQDVGTGIGHSDLNPFFQFVVVRDPQASVPEPYRLWRVENEIVVRNYRNHSTVRPRWPFKTGGGIIGPMGVLIDP